MTRARRTVCGRRYRRETVRHTKRKYWKGSIDAKKASARRKLQIRWSNCIHMAAKMALFTACFTDLFQASAIRDDADPFCGLLPAERGMYGNYALMSHVLFMIYLNRAVGFEQQDMTLYDIPPEELHEHSIPPLLRGRKSTLPVNKCEKNTWASRFGYPAMKPTEAKTDTRIPTYATRGRT